MNDKRWWDRVGEAFAGALEHEEPERSRWLERELADEPELLAEVRSLLAADSREHRLLDGSAMGTDEVFAADALSAATPAPEIGTRIGAWRLEKPLGEGGMGIVYLAQRAEDDFVQRAALKLIKRGMDTASIVRRFEQERRIVAGLEHPNIARLLDGGSTTDGLPWFAMEYVEGEPIDRYCERRGLGVDGRLALFIEVCRAVVHAHASLVVHRDLKPQNILVTADGVPKLLDFGIARLLDGDRDTTRLTRVGLQVLTPAYAAPEQLKGDSVGTPADIYALGMILKELLTGVQSADLEAIWTKALRPEPEARYASVDALADDLERHRQGLPVRARGDARRYRWGKFLARNRRALGGFAAAVILIVALTGFYTERLSAERDRAAQQAERAEAVTEFMVELFESGESALSARVLLDRGSERIGRELAAQPELHGRLLQALGQAYYNLGEDEAALDLFRQSLERGLEGPDAELEYLDRLSQVAMTHSRIGEIDAASEAYRTILERRRELLGEPHEDVAEALMFVGIVDGLAGRAGESDVLLQESVVRLEESVAMLETLEGDRTDPLVTTLDYLADARAEVGDLAGAETAWLRADSLIVATRGELDPERVRTQVGLALVRRMQDDRDGFETLMADAERLVREAHPEGSPEHLEALLVLANHWSASASRQTATRLYQEVAEEAAEHLEPNHRLVSQAFSGLTELLVRIREYPAALPWAERAHDVTSARLGDRHNLVARSSARVGQVHLILGDPVAAIPYLERSAAIRRELGHVALGSDLEGLGSVLYAAGRVAESVPVLREAVPLQPSPVGRARLELRLGRAELDLGNVDEARELLRGAVAVLEAELGEKDPMVELGRTTLAQAEGS